MAFKEKYYFEYKDPNEKGYRTVIAEDTTEVVSLAEIEGEAEPLIVEYPVVKHKFETVRGSGCELNINSDTDRRFFGLYTADMMKYQVRHYAKDSGLLLWCGYLTSELYSEDFSQLNNYSVQFTGADFSILERLNFVDSDGKNIEDIRTEWDVIKLIIQKLGLPFNGLYVKISTSISGISPGADETIFHKTNVNCNNYIDEDNNPMSCREVLEAVLFSYGSYIQQINGSIIITDINTICQDTSQGPVTFQGFSISDFLFMGNYSRDMLICNFSPDWFASDRQDMDTIAGINKQVITYSPYKQTEIINFKAQDDLIIEGLPLIMGTSPYRWLEYRGGASPSWAKFNNGMFCKLQGYEDTNNTQKDFYLKINAGVGYSSLSFRYQKKLPYVLPASNKLKINLKAYVRKSDDMDNPANVPSEVHVLVLYCKMMIGDRKFSNYPQQPYPLPLPFLTKINGIWYSPPAGMDDSTVQYFQMFISPACNWTEHGFDITTAIEDTWIDYQDFVYNQSSKQSAVRDILIPLPGDTINEYGGHNGIVGGLLEFEIYGFEVYVRDSTHQGGWIIPSAAVSAKIKDIRIKDFAITLVDEYGNEVDSSDLEYTGKLNPHFKNEGEKLKLLHGTNISLNPLERGALMGFDGSKYYFLQQWTKEGETNLIENLLLRSIQSNYEFQSIQLKCTTNMLPSLLGYLTYTNYLPGKKFMIAGARMNYSEATCDLTIIEMNKDSLEIISS